MRGKERAAGDGQRAGGITPACAGKSGSTMSSTMSTRDHPRVCGEKFLFSPPFPVGLGSPPRVRGKDVVHAADAHDSGITPRVRGKGDAGVEVAAGTGITPACAGKSNRARRSRREVWDHPRVCGEKRGPCGREVAVMGSPPRVRGKEVGVEAEEVDARITPACAGKRLKRSQYKAIFSIQHRVIPLVLNKVEAP